MGLLNFYNLLVIFDKAKKDDRDILIGKCQAYNELTQLSEQIKVYLDNKSKGRV